MKEKDIYKTDSVYLASYLLSEDIPPIFIERLNDTSNQFIFSFPFTESSKDLIKNYTEQKALVQPQKYQNSYKTLLQAINQERSQYESR